MKKRDNRGFTLVELIIVIAIVAVLAAVVSVNYVSYLGKAKTAVCASNLKELSHVYFIDASTAEGANYASILEQTLRTAGCADLSVSTDGEKTTVKYTGSCPTDGTCSIVLDSASGEFRRGSCTEHGNILGLEALKGVDAEKTLQSAFSEYLGTLDDDFDWSKDRVFDTYGTDQTMLIKKELESLGYVTDENSLWRVVAKSPTEYCIYWVDLTAEQLEAAKNATGTASVAYSGKQIYVKQDGENVTTTEVENPTIWVGKEAKKTYATITNKPQNWPT